MLFACHPHANETTRPWARSIREKVASREMPPWAADPAHSMKMRNDRSLSQRDIDTVVAWVAAGAPRGNPADLPPAPTFASGWQLGESNFVFEQPVEWTVKPDAQEPYLYFYEKIPFTEDKFATGVEMRPSNFSVMHHSGVFVVDIPDGYTVKDGYLYDAAGSKITNVAIYDNSVKNRWNPAPEKDVYWSEQSWDERYQPTTQFSVDSRDLTKAKKPTSDQPRQQ